MPKWNEDREHRLRRIQLIKQGKNHPQIDKIFEQEENERLEKQRQKHVIVNIQTENVELKKELLETEELLDVSEWLSETRNLEFEKRLAETQRLLSKSEKTIREFRKSIGFGQDFKNFSEFVKKQQESGKKTISFKTWVITHPNGEKEIEKVEVVGYGEIPVEVYNAFIYANFDELFVKPTIKLIEEELERVKGVLKDDDR